ncbi:unnamed protein product, partial [Staurois parvus]
PLILHHHPLLLLHHHPLLHHHHPLLLHHHHPHHHPLLHPLLLLPLLFLLFVFLLQVTAHVQIFLSVKKSADLPIIAAKIGRSAKSADFFSNFTDKKNLPKYRKTAEQIAH